MNVDCWMMAGMEKILRLGPSSARCHKIGKLLHIHDLLSVQRPKTIRIE